MWWDDDRNWAGWLAMSIGMAGFWILVALLVPVVVRAGSAREADRLEPRRILERRLARGEIDIEKYRELLEAMTRAPS